MAEEKTIELGHFATIILRGDGTGSIDGALIDDDERPDDWKRSPFHVAVDSLFTLALQHALRGIDVTSNAYADGFAEAMADLDDADAGDFHD